MGRVALPPCTYPSSVGARIKYKVHSVGTTMVTGIGFRFLHFGCSQRTATSAFAYYVTVRDGPTSRTAQRATPPKHPPNFNTRYLY
jgi:hypothetical protein